MGIMTGNKLLSKTSTRFFRNQGKHGIIFLFHIRFFLKKDQRCFLILEKISHCNLGRSNPNLTRTLIDFPTCREIVGGSHLFTVFFC